jgi:magnesium transporter
MSQANNAAEVDAAVDDNRAVTGSGFSSGLGRAFFNRTLWLLILTLAAIFFSSLQSPTQALAEHMLVLAIFMPLLVSVGGNAAGQSASLVVRAQAGDQIPPRLWGRILGRELIIALFLAVTFGVVGAVVGFVQSKPVIAVIVALSMFAIVIVGCLIGALVPLLIGVLKLDATTAAAPLAMRICDAAGMMIYFGIATAFLT